LEARASSRFIRIAPRKARQVVSLIKGQGVDEALAILSFTPKRGGKIFHKLLTAAKSNALQNPELTGKQLFVKNALVDEGPSLKRVKPRARGRRDIFKKRTSHISVIVHSLEGEV
jgi:large subunit ribosomal protein L22